MAATAGIKFFSIALLQWIRRCLQRALGVLRSGLRGTSRCSLRMIGVNRNLPPTWIAGEVPRRDRGPYMVRNYVLLSSRKSLRAELR